MDWDDDRNLIFGLEKHANIRAFGVEWSSNRNWNEDATRMQWLVVSRKATINPHIFLCRSLVVSCGVFDVKSGQLSSVVKSRS